jgi:hypothetical protein
MSLLSHEQDLEPPPPAFRGIPKQVFPAKEDEPCWLVLKSLAAAKIESNMLHAFGVLFGSTVFTASFNLFQ